MANEKRLIDANALMEVIKEKHDWVMQDPEVIPSVKWGEAVCHGRVSEAIEKAPAVDAVEVKHGRWKNGDPYCPVCGKDKFAGLDADVWADWKPDYCPNCGAKMDLEHS